MPTLWEQTIAIIRGKVSDAIFDAWFRFLSFRELEGDTITLAVPNRFTHDWIHDHYQSFIEEELAGQAGRAISVQLIIDPEEEIQESSEPEPEPEPTVAPTPRDPSANLSSVSHLNPKYTFDHFVTGPSNQFACAAARAVAEKPASNYNPLFLFGGVGLGKTHLLQGIGWEILRRNPSARIVCLSSETFMNDMINSLRNQRMEQFRTTYRRNCDLLLMDDIQFIAGKQSTQEEFFHTFNALYESHRQIVVTSDKFPQDIPDLEERIRSRFQWGLIADLQPPEMETRIAIIKSKAEYDGIVIPDDVAIFLATNIKSNVRELEGSLIRVAAYASLTNAPITLDLARESLKDLLSGKNRVVSIEQIQKAVANYYNIRVQDLKSQSRQKAVALPRQVAMYLCRRHTSSSYPEIGNRFGGKDHSTVINAVKKIEKKITTDLDLRGQVDHLERSFTE